MRYNIGIDIGGTAIKMGVVDENASIVDSVRFPTRSKDGTEAIKDDIISHCRCFFDKYTVSSIGVGCPGDKNSANTSILAAGNLPFENFPIVDILTEAFGVDVYLDNDGNCAVCAEWLAGCGKGKKDIVTITIGTGIGGGCVVNGSMLRGVNNDGGELGHFVIDPEGEECPCGQKGCFEKFASATALIKMTQKAIRENPDSLLAHTKESDVNGYTVFEAVSKGCEVAKQVLDGYGKRLATGINGLNYIFAPEIIVLAGGITNEGDALLSAVRPYLLCKNKVFISSLGNAGIIGAAMLDREKEYYMSLRNNTNQR